jgi:hypothetical protein
MADAKVQFEPKIAAAQNQLLAGQLQFSQSNQVTILKTTTRTAATTISIDAVNCPTTRPDCKDTIYKSNEFKAGEIANIYGLIGGDGAFSSSSYAQMNLGMLQTIDQQVKDGLISLNNAIAYNNAVSTIRTQYQNVISLSQQYALAKSSATSALEKVRDMKPMIDAAIVSAKRAGKNNSIFEKAFVTSFKFEYNAKRLDQLARAPWTYISNLKELRNAVSVTNQSELADSISNRYSFKAANSINATYRNLFLAEQDYREGFQLVALLYKNAIGKSISAEM